MYAAIDIGTNTVLLSIADVSGQNLELRFETQRVPRLGKGVDRDKKLREKQVQKVISVLKEYRRILSYDYPQVRQTIVTATSAVRDATNRESFRQKVKNETGFEVIILSGVEEAEWMYKGAVSVLNRSPGSLAVVLDIGGGSTEMAAGKGNCLQDRFSFDMGSIRYTERFLKHDPPLESEINRCRRAIRKELETWEMPLYDTDEIIGIAGTATTLAFMDSGLKEYDSEVINGYTLEAGEVARITRETMKYTSVDLLRRYPAVMEGRADVITGGLLILEECIGYYKLSKLVVSTGGIRHGALLYLAQKEKGAE